MQAIFYNFSKRKNSTAVPDGQGNQRNLTLKNGSSIIDGSWRWFTDEARYS